MSNTKTIAKNSGWFGLENIVSAIVSLFTSIAINNYLGPTKNGYIIYISQIACWVSILGGMGLPATTRKYMAEFIGMGDRGIARSIFTHTLLLQVGLATLATGGLLVWVLGDAGADYKLASVLLVLSIWPAMVNSVPAQANVATEDFSTNMPASVISTAVYFSAIGATIFFHWGVTGVGMSLLVMRAVDFLVRFFPTMKRVLAWEAHAYPPGLRNRMMTFACSSVGSMIVSMVVWGRSEIFLLKHLCTDIRQVSFYSLSFSMADQLLLGATIFGGAAGATIFAQYGRDKSRLPAITASTFRYLALTSIPLHFIAASLAVPALLLLYGHQFQDAALVATLAPPLCMFKAFITPAQNLLQSAERQRYVIGATVLAAIIDIGVAWYFIRGYGAVGACFGNGAAQAVAVGLMWGAAIYLYKVKLPWVQVAKIAFGSAIASLTAHLIASYTALLAAPYTDRLIASYTPHLFASYTAQIAARLPSLLGILAGGSASLVVLFALFYLMRVLEPEDRDRFGILTGMLPKPVAGPVSKVLSVLIRTEYAGITPGNV